MVRIKSHHNRTGKKSKGLVTNSTAVLDEDTDVDLKESRLESITSNISPRSRHERMEGRDYLVVPMIMLTEGVHAGSNGPLYYPSSELAKTPVVWNHKPVVVYHPTSNGQAISACEPVVISRRKVGIIMNTRYEAGKNGQAGKLKAEAWLEVNRLKKVDNRVFDAIESGEMMEVSTGLFTDNEETDGKWKRETYNSIARNYRPDHLAILPDEKGACSIEDGAGLMRNSAKKQQIGAAMKTKKKVVNALIANESTNWEESDRDFLMNLENDQLAKIWEPIANAQEADDEAQEVEVEEAAPETNAAGKGKNAKKAAAAKLAKTGKDGKPVANAKKDDEAQEVEDDDTDDEPAQNQQQTQLTLNEFLGTLPDQLRDHLVSSLRSTESRRVKLIGSIVSNKKTKFTKQELATLNMEMLEKLASGLSDAKSKQTMNFLGLGSEVGMGQDTPVDNAEEEPLDIPVMNFERKSA